MSFSNVTESALLALIFNATAWANYADNAAASPQTDIAVALHTADPGEAGSMSSNEATYTSYARQAVPRSAGGWTVSGGAVSPVADIGFPAGTGGSGTATHFSVGKTGGGAAAILMSGTITPNIITGDGITPILKNTTTITLD